MNNALIPVDIDYNANLAQKSVWKQMGFRFGASSTHTSRTIMLEELSELFGECSRSATRNDYITAIVDHNCLSKQTASNRRITGRRMRELYGLDPSLIVFRILRYYWYIDEKGRPLLALLAALARDPLLRVASTPILKMEPGEELSREQMVEVIRQRTGKRLNDSTVDKVARNASSSWTQTGHLEGRVRKIRRQVDPTPAVTAYALFLGYLLGIRGSGLFKTLWAKVLDRSQQELIQLTKEAKRLGFIDMSYSGGIVDISIDCLLTEDERRLVRE
jgi:hypothetical protein